MGRPREYATAAERQRAYRRRLAEEWAHVPRRALEQLHEQLVQLKEAMWDAARAGDTTADRCLAGSIETTLWRLTKHFQEQAQTREKRPETEASGGKAPSVSSGGPKGSKRAKAAS